MANKTCKNCIYLYRAQNCPDTFICTNKHNKPGRLFILKEEKPCRNYSAAFVPHRPKIRQPADPNTRFIPLTQGRFAIVDADDYDWLNQYKWHICKKGKNLYAVASIKGREMLMHRLIMNPPPGLVVDHIDINSLNNKRENLRICTQGQNNYNRKGQSKTSKYKGVYREKNFNKWRVTIGYNSKTINLGSFDNEIDAAKAYDKKAKELFGKFAYLNFPDES